MILYDYRTMHRGAPNPEVGGRERPVAYVLVSVPGGGRDTYNFPESSIFGDVSLDTLSDFPFFRETQKSGASFAPMCSMLSAVYVRERLRASYPAPRPRPEPPVTPHPPPNLTYHGERACTANRASGRVPGLRGLSLLQHGAAGA